MVVTAVLTYGILMFDGRGFRPIELIIGSLVVAIVLCYLAEMFIAPIDWAAAELGTVVPRLPDAGALTTRGRHCRRDDHAARDLFAFGPHPEPGPGTR